MRNLVVLLVSLLLWAVPSPSLGYTFDRLDDVFLEAENVRTFLDSPDLLTRYFNILHHYLGRNPERPQFDAIVERLKRSVDASPEYGRYLEEAPNVAHGFEFSAGFSTAIGPCGRDLNFVRWQIYWTQRLESLDQLSRQGTLDAADASVLLSKIREPAIAALFQSDDPDLILSALKQIWNENREAAIHTGFPNPSSLLQNQALFPIRMVTDDRGVETIDESFAGNYRFRPLPRRIHGIFRTLYSGGIQGANIDAIATELSPESNIHFIERDGLFVGYTRLTPIKIGRKTYAKLEIGAPLLGQKSIQFVNGRPHISSLFDLWLVQAQRHLPTHWAGIVVTQNPNTENQTTIQMVTQSSAFALGKQITPDLVALNPRITQLSPEQFAEMIQWKGSALTRVKASQWLLSSTTAQAHMIRNAIADKVSAILLAENAEIFRRVSRWRRMSDELRPFYGFSWKLILQALRRQPQAQIYAGATAAVVVGGLYGVGWSGAPPTDLLSHLILLGHSVGMPASLPYLLNLISRIAGAMDPVFQEVGTRLAMGHAAAVRAGAQGRLGFCARYIAAVAGY